MISDTLVRSDGLGAAGVRSGKPGRPVVGEGSDSRGSGCRQESHMIRLCAPSTDRVWLRAGRRDGALVDGLCGSEGGAGREVVWVDE